VGSLPDWFAGAIVDEEAALLGTIAADPDADLPRLVYADWLEDRGDDGRAAFVRTQVQLAREPEWSPLAVRCKHFDPDALTGAPWRDTLPPLSPRIAAWHPETPFRRGLPDWLIVRDLASFLDIADRLLEVTPVTTLSLPTSALPFWQEFARRPWLRRVKELSFYGLSTPIEPLRLLADAPNASNVESLTLESTTSPAIPTVLSDLFASPLGSRLKRLDLRVGGDPAGEWLEGIESLPECPPLEALDLRTMQLGLVGALRLRTLPFSRRLRRFHFRGQQLDPRTVRTLLALCNGPRVEDFALTGVVSEVALKGNLFGSGAAGRLRRLDVSDSPVALRGFGRCAAVQSAASLVLRNCRLRGADIGEVIQRPGWADTVEFDFRGNGYANDAAGRLLSVPPPKSLAALALPGRGLSARTRGKLRDHFNDAVRFDDG
jgi:uncharacterized protein (TIGR02996 family)